MSDRAQEYFTALQQAIDEERTSDIIDISSQILDFLPDDQETKLCRAVAYIMDDQFDDALVDLANLKGCEFERAYCLYKLEKLTEALAIIEKLPQNVRETERFLHLHGQILFRLDNPKECLSIYSKLNTSDLSNEDLVNLSAVYAINGLDSQITQIINNESLAQQVYNTAVCLVQSGKKSAAIEFIKKGEAMVQDKTSLISQLFMLLGIMIEYSPNTESFDPKQALLSLIENETSNAYVRAIAACNFASIESNEHLSVAKKFRHLFSDFDKITKFRKCEIEAFLVNNFIISCRIGEPKKALNFADKAEKITFINPLIAESFRQTIEPGNAPSGQYAPIFTAQSLISGQKFSEAANVLIQSPFGKQPRGIAVITELLYAAHENEKAIEFLHKVENDSIEFNEFAARFALRINKGQDAVKWSEKLAKAAQNAPWTVALLVISYSVSDIEMAERYVQRLKFVQLSEEQATSIEESSIKISKIEESANVTETKVEPVATFINVETTARRKRKREEMSPEKLKRYKAKHKRRRRLQLPKNYDPQRVPDPERWIRKNQRSAAKNRKNKKPQAPKPAKVGKPIEPPKPAAPPAQPQPAKAKKGGKKKGGKSKW